MELDPLSAASAGLFARGIKGNRRSEVLELLSSMLDLADGEGNVALDEALYAVEQRLGVNYCLEAYTWLEEMGVVTRTSNGWAIPAFGLHIGPVGNTVDSMHVLQRHLAAMRAEAEATPLVVVPVPAEADPEVVVPMKRWRRSVPMAAAGIAASVAVVAGVSQFVPQAAVSGRNAAVRAAAPTSVIPHAAAGAPTTVAGAGVGRSTTSAVAANPSTSAVATPSTGGVVAAVVCLAPRVVTAITSVDVVALPLAGDHGQTIWAAVVKGTAALSESDAAVLLPGLSVVGHLVDGDTDPVLANLAAPMLVPGKPALFSAVVALGNQKPATEVTATATPAGLKTCP
jgi:hypothetical protein